MLDCFNFAACVQLLHSRGFRCVLLRFNSVRLKARQVNSQWEKFKTEKSHSNFLWPSQLVTPIRVHSHSCKLIPSILTHCERTATFTGNS